MGEGRLSGSFIGGKAARRTYRYEVSYRRDGDALCYSSTVWCDGHLRAEPCGTISNLGSAQNDDVIRRQIHASIERLANIDSKIAFARSRKTDR